MKIKHQDIQRLNRRYELRAEGMEVRDICDQHGNPEQTADVLQQITSQFKHTPDRLAFRQGFIYRGWENRQ